jgi:hypothetical protein
VVPFKVRFHVAEAVRISLAGGTKGASSHQENLPRELSFDRETVESTQSESTEVVAERLTGVLLQNQATEMAKEGVPLVELESDEREARILKATKTDDS